MNARTVWLTLIKCSVFLLFIFLVMPVAAEAQCSICTKTAQQLGEKPAKGLNLGILYLALTPFLIAGVVAYFWWKRSKA